MFCSSLERKHLEAASPAATPGHAPWDNICISKFIFAWGLHNQSQDCGCSMLGPGSAPRKVMENFSSHFLLMKDQNMKSICFISFVGTWQPAVSQCLQFAHFKPDVLKWVKIFSWSQKYMRNFYLLVDIARQTRMFPNTPEMMKNAKIGRTQ